MWDSRWISEVTAASHPRVATVSNQTVLMAPASRSGMNVWSHTPT